MASKLLNVTIGISKANRQDFPKTGAEPDPKIVFYANFLRLVLEKMVQAISSLI